MSEDVLNKLFKKYNTFNHTKKSLNINGNYIQIQFYYYFFLYLGIGLGLTICKKLVKTLGPYKKLFVES